MGNYLGSRPELASAVKFFSQLKDGKEITNLDSPESRTKLRTQLQAQVKWNDQAMQNNSGFAYWTSSDSAEKYRAAERLSQSYRKALHQLDDVEDEIKDKNNLKLLNSSQVLSTATHGKTWEIKHINKKTYYVLDGAQYQQEAAASQEAAQITSAAGLNDNQKFRSKQIEGMHRIVMDNEEMLTYNAASVIKNHSQRTNNAATSAPPADSTPAPASPPPASPTPANPAPASTSPAPNAPATDPQAPDVGPQERVSNPVADNAGGLMAGLGTLMLMMFMGVDIVFAAVVAMLLGGLFSFFNDGNGFVQSFFGGGAKASEGASVLIEKEGQTPQKMQEIYIDGAGKLTKDTAKAAYKITGDVADGANDGEKVFAISGIQAMQNGQPVGDVARVGGNIPLKSQKDAHGTVVHFVPADTDFKRTIAEGGKALNAQASIPLDGFAERMLSPTLAQDTNRNNKISKAEATAGLSPEEMRNFDAIMALPENKAKKDALEGGGIAIENVRNEFAALEQKLRTKDTNNDGKLSREEAAQGNIPLFDQLLQTMSSIPAGGTPASIPTPKEEATKSASK